MKPNPDQLFDRIKTSKSLPTLPHILLKLIDACNDPESTIETISKIIDKDSSLSARVMKMVNSAYFSLPVRVTGVEQALLLLGTEAVKNIAVSAAVSRVFGATKGDDVFKLKLFWYHCLLCATIAELVAAETSYSSPDEAFLSGLLHDIGKLVLWVNFPKDYTQVLQNAEGKVALLEKEQQLLGVTHSEVGAWMIGHWHLQSFMADAVQFHHEPAEKIIDALPLVKIVFLANLLSTDGNQDSEIATKAAETVFGFSESQVSTLVSQGKENVEEVARSLGIEIESPESSAFLDEQEHQKEVDLLRNVRDVSLLQGTLQNLLEASGEKAILATIKQGLQVLFDIHDVVFLLHPGDENILVGKGGLEPPRDSLVKELAISLETKNCLPVQCLEQKRPLDSLGNLQEMVLAIVDRQIVRLLGKDGVLCLPMIAHNTTVGVIALALEKASAGTICKQLNLLSMFSRQSALALYADSVRQAQAKIVQSERLAAASAISKKVVHEVNNPLGIIKNYIKIFGLKMPKEDPVQEELNIINEELDRVSQIVGKLSDFSDPEAKQKEPVDVNGLLSDLAKITYESLRINAKVKTHLHLEPSLPTVFSEKNALKQVFINLIKNAVEAMPKGGNLFISTDYIPGHRTDESMEPLDKSGTVEIRVRDDGVGIPETLKAKLFEPFVTSKTAGHAGLGLSVVYSIVKELNGSITCESGEKEGTIFTVALPVGPNQVT